VVFHVTYDPNAGFTDREIAAMQAAARPKESTVSMVDASPDESRRPTTEEWRDHFLTLDPDAQLAVVEQVFKDQETAHQCFLQNHTATLARVPEVTAELSRVETLLRGMITIHLGVADELDIAAEMLEDSSLDSDVAHAARLRERAVQFRQATNGS
jgi:hypothetical protein